MRYEREIPQGRPRGRAGRHRKPVLAVQAMVGEIAWLDGALRWQGERVRWESRRGLVAPTLADLALAQRRLYQIGRYPIAARRVPSSASRSSTLTPSTTKPSSARRRAR